MTEDQERWAEALAVIKQHGDEAPIHVAVRVGEFARAGDQLGIDRWKAIAYRLDQLMQAQMQ